ncbi:MAG: mechanosensitive ion channel family protein [Candidatus Altiarchaeota archaeon]|nr:mechanosensitive ion channel family protein [Candidatus Altiarchaeota archaeon]
MVNQTGNLTETPVNAFLDNVVKQLSLGGGCLENNILLFILVILASILAARVANYLIDRYVQKLVSMTKSELDDKILASIHKPIYYIIILMGFQIALTLFFKPTDVIFKIIITLLVIVASLAIADIIVIVLNDFGKKLAKQTETSIDDEAIPFLSKLMRFIVYIMGLMIILDLYGIEITPMIAGLGIAGFAIGFASKDTISNLLAGFFILLDRPFTKGDRIKSGDNLGAVVDIGLRSTKIETLDHTYVIIPNSEIVSKDVINYSLPNMQIKVRATFGVAYGSNPGNVKDIILEVATKSDYVMNEPKPVVYFREFADSSINFLLIFWVSSFKDRLKAIDDINTGVYARFAQENIEIPYPCRTIYLKEEQG